MVKSFDLFGVQADFYLKGSSIDIVPVDRNLLEFFFRKDKKIQLYYEGLKKANVEWSDNFLKQCRIYSLQQMVRFVMKKKLSADFVECGCWKGHSTYIISKILSQHGFSNTFHVFDSFEGGLSEKMEQDKNLRHRQSEDDIRYEKKYFASTEAELHDAIKEFDFIKIYKGWIPTRFAEVERINFAFVHIDVDLYQPTLESLKFFFPRLLPGGVIVVDDYGYTQFPGAKRAVDELLAANDCYLFYETPIGSCFIIK